MPKPRRAIQITDHKAIALIEALAAQQERSLASAAALTIKGALGDQKQPSHPITLGGRRCNPEAAAKQS